MRTVAYVAPARIKSVVLDFAKQASMSSYEIVDIITMMIRTEKVLTRLHIMTGIIRRRVTKTIKRAFAVRRIQGPL